MAVAMLARPSAVLWSIMPTPTVTPCGQGRAGPPGRRWLSGALYLAVSVVVAVEGDAVLAVLPGDGGQGGDVLHGGDVPQGDLLAGLGGDGVVQQGGDVARTCPRGTPGPRRTPCRRSPPMVAVMPVQQIVDLHGHRRLGGAQGQGLLGVDDDAALGLAGVGRGSRCG